MISLEWQFPLQSYDNLSFGAFKKPYKTMCKHLVRTLCWVISTQFIFAMRWKDNIRVYMFEIIIMYTFDFWTQTFEMNPLWNCIIERPIRRISYSKGRKGLVFYFRYGFPKKVSEYYSSGNWYFWLIFFIIYSIISFGECCIPLSCCIWFFVFDWTFI